MTVTVAAAVVLFVVRMILLERLQMPQPLLRFAVERASVREDEGGEIK